MAPKPKKYNVGDTYLEPMEPMACIDRMKSAMNTKHTADIAPVKHIAPLDFAWIIVPATTNMFGASVAGLLLS